MKNSKDSRRLKIRKRIRGKIKGTNEQPRLSVSEVISRFMHR